MYAAPGTYNVKLSVSNGTCEHFVKKDVVVIKEKGKLEVSDLVSCINTRLIFNVANVAASNISTYSWFFNDITQSGIVTANNPVATVYSSAGDRVAAVVLTDILKCKDTLTIKAPVKTYGPRVAFGSLLSNTCYGTTINFQDLTKADGIHPIAEWQWNFGEGTPQTYTAGPFSHDYSAVGTYNVKLLVKDTYGCKDSLTRVAFVSILKPVAKFTASDTLICPAAPITFSNQSQGTGVNYFWSFGDTTTSNEVSPVHQYSQPGTYRVKLLMIDKNGCRDSMSLKVKVFTATADFSLDTSFTTCPPLLVNATNKSTNYIDYNWSYGDGGNSQLLNPSHIYTYPGTYYIQLIVKNNGGCADTLRKPIVIQGPTGSFNYTPKEVCNPGKVKYDLTADNTVRYTWDFNDGSAVNSTSTTISHTYTDPGTYVPKVILWDASGCPVPVRGKDTIKVDGIKTNILVDNRVLCDSGYVVFKDLTTSNDVVSSYSWQFGDGATSTGKNPTHHYSQTGLYTVKLATTTRFGCVDTTSIENCVKIVTSPSIKIVGDTSACEPAVIAFKGDINKSDTSALQWSWDFGGNDTSSLQAPGSKTFAIAGIYSIKVKATNPDGCTDVATKKAVIHPKPVIDAGADTIICKFNTHLLSPTGADTYTWTAEPSLSCVNCTTPIAKPLNLATTYHVVGKTIYGCASEDSVTIKVKQPFKMAVARGDTLCTGESFNLQASGADAYQWSPSTGLSNTTIANPVSRLTLP